ncbi:hypothetical protein V8E54_013848 [Elaphomyces granulatus]
MRLLLMGKGVQRLVPASPACPGKIKPRARGPLSRLPDSDILAAFKQLRHDKRISDEEAVLRFTATYDADLRTLSQVALAKIPFSFSRVTYKQVAPYVWLDPKKRGRDIRNLDVFRARIPRKLLWKIVQDVDESMEQYGRMNDQQNEETRSRFIASLFNKIVCVFGHAIINRPEGIITAEFTRNGRIEHHFIAFESATVVFIEVKKALFVNSDEIDIKAQVLAECSACDYSNANAEHWTPILAILCDGEKFFFMVYDSGDRAIYQSQNVITGLVDREGYPLLFLRSIQHTAEYLFDFFIMGYINGLRSFCYNSQKAATRTPSKKRESTEHWTNALKAAEQAHLALREASRLATEESLEAADTKAEDGIRQLKSSVSLLPGISSQKILQQHWDGTDFIENLKGD